MTDLMDYSGDFDPAFSYEDFSKETLQKLLETYSKYILRIDGYWYISVMDKWGNDGAFECDVKVWEKMLPWEVSKISDALNIKGDNLAALMKYFQVAPWMWNLAFDIDFKNPNHSVVTITHCPTLVSLEKEGTGREKPICRELEPKMMEAMAHHFNPEIKVTGLKMPPRTDYKDCCCQWEFKL
ncbi:DUF6125 family protein [Thermodesulfobacteriota bacterium]